MLTIRKAERRDLPALGRLGAMLMRTHHDFDSKRFLPAGADSERGYASFLGTVLDSPDDCVYVADRDGLIVGYVYAALEPLSWKELRGPAGFVHDVAVVEKSRRAGTAIALMNAAVEWLRAHGAPRIILWTASPNEAARALFRRMGFRETMIEMTRELDE